MLLVQIVKRNWCRNMCKRKQKEKPKEIIKYKVICTKDKNGIVYVKCPNCNTTLLQTRNLRYTSSFMCPYCNSYLEY